MAISTQDDGIIGGHLETAYHYVSLWDQYKDLSIAEV